MQNPISFSYAAKSSESIKHVDVTNCNELVRDKSTLIQNKPRHPDYPEGVHYSASLNDARHEKTDLKVFVVVIPKEGWPNRI